MVRLFSGSQYAPEARFRLVVERRRLRLAKGNKLYPWYALQWRGDLETYLQRHRRGRFVMRVRWELAPVYFDLWLLSRPAFQRTSDYRDYRKVGGKPVDAAAGERYRQAALRLYRACFARLTDVLSTYRSPGESRHDLQRARRHQKLLGQAQPPPNLLPSTFFPPG